MFIYYIRIYRFRCFNSHRYCKNPVSGMSISPRTAAVSIPHRYCKTYVKVRMSTPEGLVSPHRYCKNPHLHCAANMLAWQFQFLIGTVTTRHIHKSSINYIDVSIPHRYCKNEVRLQGTDTWQDGFNSS